MNKSKHNIEKFANMMKIKESKFYRGVNKELNNSSIFFNVKTKEIINSEVIDYTRITSHNVLTPNEPRQGTFDKTLNEGWVRIVPETEYIFYHSKYEEQISEIEFFNNYNKISKGEQC